jgi:AcrR family transcriptional regulator
MAKRLPNPRKVKRMIIRQNIFHVTAGLIREIDYADLTVRMICAEADVSVGMFYRNFQSKDDVLTLFYEEIAEAYEREMRDHLAGMHIKDQLIGFYSWVASYAAEFGLEFVRRFLNPNSVSIKSDYAENQIVSIGKALLDGAVDRGEITLSENCTTFDVTHDILVIVKGSLLDWAISGGTYNLQDYVRMILGKTIKCLL